MVNDSPIQVIRWKTDSHGPLSESALVNLLEQQGYRCTRYTYPAGTYFPEHHHDVHKADAVLKGRFKISMYGKSVILTAGDYILIPAKSMHSAEVIGSESVVSIDAVKIS